MAAGLLNDEMTNSLLDGISDAAKMRDRYYFALKEIAEMAPIDGQTEEYRREQSMRRCAIMQAIALKALNEK